MAAAYGTLLHHWKETSDAMPEWAAPKDIKLLREKLDLSGFIPSKGWPEGEGEHEVTFAISLRWQELWLFDGPREDMNLWKEGWDPRAFLTGTMDWLAPATAERIAWVDDLKTSHWPPDPKESKQLRSYLLVPWVQAGCPVKWKGMVSVTQWEKYPKAGRPKRRKAVFTGLDMLAHVQDLRWALEHPDEVNCLPDTYNEDGSVDELSPCTWCDCREEIPGVSEWMDNYRHRRAVACWPGMLSVVDFTKPIPRKD